jgi:hypothetical protein
VHVEVGSDDVVRFGVAEISPETLKNCDEGENLRVNVEVEFPYLDQPSVDIGLEHDIHIDNVLHSHLIV